MPNRDGFALLVVIFTMAILGLLAVASLATAHDEQRSSRALRESGIALYVAEAGAHATRGIQIDTSGTTLLESLAATLAPGDSVDLGWRSLPSGAIYRPVLHRIDNGGQKLYRLTVLGRGAGLWGGKRTLTLTLTSSGSAGVTVTGALASIGGFQKSGSSGMVSGVDSASTTGRFGCPDAGQPAIPGAFGPTNRIWQGDTLPADVVDATTDWLANPGQPIPLQWGGTTAEAAAAVGVDWEQMVTLTPTLMLTLDANSIPTNWPPPAYFDATPPPMPLIFAPAGANLSGLTGNGTVVALGDATIGGMNWDGLLLIGGALQAAGITQVRGGLVTGLNYLLGDAEVVSDMGNGTKTFLYDSCKVAMANESVTAAGYTSGGLMLIGSRAWSEF